MIKLRKYFFLISIFVTPLHAEIYKCPSSDGGIIFSQNICIDGFRKDNGQWVNIAEERNEKIKKQKEEAKIKEKEDEERQKKLELERKEWQDSIAKKTENTKKYQYTLPKTYTPFELNKMINSGSYPKQGTVKTVTKKVDSFYGCKSTIKNIMSQLGSYPERVIVDTGILYTAKVWTNNGAVTTSCSKLDSKLIIMEASYL